MRTKAIDSVDAVEAVRAVNLFAAVDRPVAGDRFNWAGRFGAAGWSSAVGQPGAVDQSGAVGRSVAAGRFGLVSLFSVVRRFSGVDPFDLLDPFGIAITSAAGDPRDAIDSIRPSGAIAVVLAGTTSSVLRQAVATGPRHGAPAPPTAIQSAKVGSEVHRNGAQRDRRLGDSLCV